MGVYQQNSIWDIIKAQFKNGGVLTRLIYINAGIFVISTIIGIIHSLFGLDLIGSFVENQIILNSNVDHLVTHPWTMITYSFMHATIWHLAGNMIVLFWFGRIFSELAGERRLLSAFVLGVLFGGLFHVLSYNFIPAFATGAPGTIVGASAGVSAIVMGAAKLSPDYSINLILIGRIRLKYIAAVYIGLDVLLLASNDGISHFAHLGGALGGYLFAQQLQAGRDIGKWINVLLDMIKGIFVKNSESTIYVHKAGKRYKAPKTKVKKKKAASINAKESQKDTKQKKIDAILDKISQSGYEKLTAEEKEILMKYSRQR